MSKYDLSHLFWRKSQPEETPQIDITPRLNRAAESILENERLTANLDDDAAQALLDWGTACANIIVQQTSTLNDEEADAFIEPRLKATRRMMRSVNKWTTAQQIHDVERALSTFAKIIEQMAVIYDDGFTPPPPAECVTFSNQQSQNTPLQMITHLRQWLQNAMPKGERYD